MKGFNSVNRKGAPVAADGGLDPLSMFVMQTDDEPEERTPTPPRAPSPPPRKPVVVTPPPVASPVPQNYPPQNYPPAAAPSTISSSSGSFKTSSYSAKFKQDDLQSQIASLSNTFSSTISSISNSLANSSIASNSPMVVSKSAPDLNEEIIRSNYQERESNLNNSQLTPQQQEAIEGFKFLSGEQKIMSIPNCCIQIFAYGNINGLLYITNYRLVFMAAPSDIEPIARNNPNIYSYLQVPLGCIDKIEREKRPKDSISSSMTVQISCKDCRQLRIHMKGSPSSNGDYEMEKAFSTMTAFAFPNNLRYVFAFNHHFPVPKEGSDLLSEFTRLGVLELGGLRFSNANQDFRLCSTYSETLIVPASVSDADLFTVAQFRAGQRLPALCWLKSDNGATLWRCSQPKCGVSGSCAQDEEMLAAIARISYNNQKFRNKRYNQELVLNIVDCRSRASAMANRAAGAGYESSANYPSCRIDFYNIPNIHAVRDSYKSLLAIVLNPTANPSSDISFTKQVDDTNWITNLRLILKAGWDTASMLMSGQPVLVHCSHGWDRTAQVCALGQLFLDPYYRTMDGFAVLVEKEWNSFGHTFFARCCQGQDKATRAEDEVSQIFMQFLDCVWQIQKQFPQYFEFNARYILTVADHVYSCRFGTFLCSSDYERRNYKISQLTPDLWTFLKCNKQTFLNPYFTEKNSILLPPLGQLLRGVTLWGDFFLRYSTVHSLPTLPSQLAKIQYKVDSEKSADLALLPMSTQSDYWEAIIKRENSHALALEQQLNDSKLNIKALILEMEEIVQGKLTEGEFSKFHALKARCLDVEGNIPKNSESFSSLQETGVPEMEDVSTPTDDNTGDSGRFSSNNAATSETVVKVRTDSVTEAGYVIPKFEEVPSEFLV